MKYTKATNYALHIIAYLISSKSQEKSSIYTLAEQFKLSPTYLSKILTQLTKAGLVSSTPGAKGGYQLAAPKETISFLDVIQAVEGRAPLLVCDMSVNHNCVIQQVITNAEKEMNNFLAEKKIIDIL
ncbi:Rrf2 family transcriptional regulator [Enterococcus sp. BWB1-3]|uniref:RrF2 family transcriptional regulator n=1 Tax=unclassified Enterococcus TaxID=2608891 RepID=UPI0019206B15|nr:MULTISPECIES: Rrf2 family transcriptional regulator [unclassified Enterococcus]MBL1229959.1 Rrf2 family transcriptional regulator [Enterococcus sp. BWB1-3]MCB5952957.1 Rrf2 family transcriptional regulator [Enterococcus sp. BWT-B8]MCB5953536.1 Rrf2 family transcriptional regulator [Enterococcus sp. CWB-B31]